MATNLAIAREHAEGLRDDLVALAEAEAAYWRVRGEKGADAARVDFEGLDVHWEQLMRRADAIKDALA